MQYFKYILLLLFFTNSLLVAKGQNIHTKIETADSLFSQKKYVEAYNIYREVVQKEKSYTLPMLLKMSFIAENSGNFTEALYYLNLYHANKPTQAVLTQINEIASKHKLSGYEIGDSEYALYFVRQYHLLLIMAISVLVVAFVVYLAWLKWKKQREILVPAVVLGALLVVFLYFYNFGYDFSRGIVANEKVFVMNAPSAAAKLMTTIGKGNSVRVVGKEDIWYKVQWNEKEGYIRATNLWLIQ